MTTTLPQATAALMSLAVVLGVAGCGAGSAGDSGDVTDADTATDDVQVGQDVAPDAAVADVAKDVAPDADAIAVDSANLDTTDATGVDVPAGCTQDTECAAPSPCMVGKCVAGGCSYAPTTGACDDGNPCTTTQCVAGGCAVDGAVDCSDGNTCTADSCDMAIGCTHTAQNGACNDGNGCTQSDTCEGGTCVGATPITCTAQDACHDAGTCNATTGTCSNPPKAAGTVCRVSAAVCDAAEICDGGNGGCPADAFMPASYLCRPSAGSCDSAEFCTGGEVACPIDGWKLSGTACNDGDACTSGDACATGVCIGGTLLGCDDFNICTIDACVPSSGCTYTPKTCDDGNACTTDSCASASVSGCLSVPVDSNTCTDGNPCTAGDHCVSGVCTITSPTSCDDGNSCTTDACSTAVGCTHTTLAVGSVCGSGQVCDATASCTDSGMVLIPGGTFWMGCNATKDANCATDENPQHKVTLSAYYVDISERTVAQYAACVTAGICTVPSAVQPTQYATYPGMTNNPVNFVDWTQARQYCRWRGAAYDLPTEAQWEMAARGDCEKNGSTASDAGCAAAMRTYPWGEAAPSSSLAVIKTNGTAAVGSIPAGDSPYGLHDMAGNVFEWSRDWYSATYYSTSASKDPLNAKPATFQVFRGGYFASVLADLRAAYRAASLTSNAPEGLGFRCVRSAAGSCTNAADMTILDTGTVLGVTLNCGLLNGDNPEYSLTCLEKATGLSDGCSTCFVDVLACSYNSCGCPPGGGGSCDKCNVLQGCAAAFSECAGFSL